MIVLFADPAVIVPAFCTVVSLQKFKPADTDVCIFCVDFGPHEFELAVQAFSTFDPSVTLERIDSAKDFDDSVWRTQLCGIGTWGRLFLDRLLSDRLKRVLYLDCDTLVFSNLQPLMDSDLGTCSVGACKDQFQFMQDNVEHRRVELGLPPIGDYFNAGVLLFDWQRVVESNLFRQTRDLLRRCRGKLPLNFADQDVLNLALDGQWCELDPAWNLMSFSLAVTQSRQPRIAHFAGPRKPWSKRCPFHLRHFSHQYGEMFRLAGPLASDCDQPPSSMRIHYRRFRDFFRQGIESTPFKPLAQSSDKVMAKERLEAVFAAYDQKSGIAQ